MCYSKRITKNRAFDSKPSNDLQPSRRQFHKLSQGLSQVWLFWKWTGIFPFAWNISQCLSLVAAIGHLPTRTIRTSFRRWFRICLPTQNVCFHRELSFTFCQANNRKHSSFIFLFNRKTKWCGTPISGCGSCLNGVIAFVSYLRLVRMLSVCVNVLSAADVSEAFEVDENRLLNYEAKRYGGESEIRLSWGNTSQHTAFSNDIKRIIIGRLFWSHMKTGLRGCTPVSCPSLRNDSQLQQKSAAIFFRAVCQTTATTKHIGSHHLNCAEHFGNCIPNETFFLFFIQSRGHFWE